MNIKAFHINQVSHNLLNIREYFDKWKLLSKVVSVHAQPKFFWQNIHLCPDQSWHWNSQLFHVQPQTKQKLHFLKIISRATYNIFSQVTHVTGQRADNYTDLNLSHSISISTRLKSWFLPMMSWDWIIGYVVKLHVGWN